MLQLNMNHACKWSRKEVEESDSICRDPVKFTQVCYLAWLFVCLVSAVFVAFVVFPASMPHLVLH